MRIEVPAPVLSCIAVLEAGGFSAHAVGGCVRDALLGRIPHDWDVCTSARPEEVATLFQGGKIIPTGLRHGTVTLLSEGMSIEITTLRRDGDYLDHRRPERVEFTTDLREDLARRDFTVGAMAYHPRDGLCDPFGGAADLERGVLRCVGHPEKRFGEDALRILRLFRFTSQLGFSPEAETLAAAGRQRALLSAVSPERISSEVNRLLIGPGVHDALCLMTDAGVLGAVLPEFLPCVGFDQRSPYHDRTVDRHTFAAVAAAPAVLEIRLALLLHDIGKPHAFTVDEAGRGHCKGHAAISREMAAGILRRLRYPKKISAYVLRLVALHSKKIPAEKPALRRTLSRLGVEFVRDMLLLKEADDSAKAPGRVSRAGRHRELRGLVEEIAAAGDCLSAAELAVDGADLLALGIPAGPRLGEVLSALLERVLDDPRRNRRDDLLEAARRMK